MFKLPAYIVFYDSPRTNQYKAILDREMAVLMANGKLKQLIMKYLDDKHYPGPLNFQHSITIETKARKAAGD